MRDREAAAKVAEADNTNDVGMCQMQTRLWLDAPSAGDFDGDGAADAEDGWKREPKSARRYDRNPPRGTPVSWLGGPNDNGHRALSLGGGRIRSTDAGGKGRVATVDLGWVERNWGLAYAGWSTTINGHEIPLPPEKKPQNKPNPKPKKPTMVTKARKMLVEARENALKNGNKTRADRLLKGLQALPKR